MAACFDANRYPLDPGLRLLEASAGTGKTFALAHLTLRLITELGHPLESLLVVTYTDAAAEELRSRIGQRLQLALAGLEQQDRADHAMGAAVVLPDPVLTDWCAAAVDPGQRRLWIRRLLVALEQLDRADIATIHSFCRRSLRRLALNSGAAMEPQLETDASALQAEVVQDLWQQELLTLPLGDLSGLRQRGLSPDSLRRCLAQLDGDIAPQLEGHAEAIQIDQPLAGQLERWITTAWRDFLPLWERDHADLEAGFRSAAEQWKALGIKSSAPYSAKPRTDRCAQVQQWIRQQDSRPTLETIAAIKKPLQDYFHPGSWSRMARKCGEAQPSLVSPALQQSIAALWDGPIERVWAYLLQKGLAELAARRRRRSVITFGGLLAALDPGEGEAPWLLPLQQRYRAVMVDEFQDTDPVQWRLLRRAFGDSPEHLLLLVGDPKQAIYRFRGGDLATYLAARERVDRTDHLLDNFRTTPPLMQGLNQLMQPGLPRSELAVHAVNPRSSASPPRSAPTLELLLASEEASKTRTALEEALPQQLAAVVLELLQADEGLDPADLCLLVSRHHQATALRRALGAGGIPTRLVSQGDVLESEAAVVLQRLLDALADPGDERALRLLACSPLLSESPDDLDDDSRLDHLAQRLRFWSERLPRLGLMGCLAQLLNGERLADLAERGRILGDLQQCARLVQEAMHRHGLDITTAADWLRRERLHPADPLPESRQPHSDQDDRAVAVVTVHRSKGLEYPVVICPYLWQAPRAVEGPLWRKSGEGRWQVCLDAGWGEGWELAQQAATASMAEAERLAYVAVTRARRQLLLVWGQVPGQEGAPLPAWLFGAEAVDQSVDQFGADRLEQALADRSLTISLRPLPDPLSPGSRWRKPVESAALGLGATPSRIDRSWGRASYSAWIATADGQTVDDPLQHEQGRDRDPGAEEAHLPPPQLWPDTGPLGLFPRGATAGDCLHRILEQVPFTPAESEQLSDPAATDLITSELRRAGLDPALTESVQEGLHRVLTTPLGGALGALTLAELGPDQRLHELSFDLPVERVRTRDLVEAFHCDPEARFGTGYADQLQALAVNSRGFLTGSIDLVFRDPRSGRWWVLDWKSNWIGERRSDASESRCGPLHYHQAAMDEQMTHHHYPLQAHLYLVALHRHLGARLPGYSLEQHLGGYVYCFLRGMPGAEGRQQDPEAATPGCLVETAPLGRVDALDQALGGMAE